MRRHEVWCLCSFSFLDRCTCETGIHQFTLVYVPRDPDCDNLFEHIVFIPDDTGKKPE